MPVWDIRAGYLQYGFLCSWCVLFILTSRVHSLAIFNVKDFGAIGDGTTLNTAAFVKSVEAVQIAGGGLLYVPPGTFLTGPFNLTSNMTLFLEAEATLLAMTDFNLWPLVSPWPSYGTGREPGTGYLQYAPFIGGYDLVHVIITGNNGTIDGQGLPWWNAHKAGTLAYTRPRLVEVLFSDHLTFSHLTLKNSPFWTLHPYSSKHVKAQDLTILAPTDGSAPNTDGFDPDSCDDVVLEDSYIATGDDGVSVKSGWDCFGVTYDVPSQNIVIRNTFFNTPCCAGVCVGSEMSGGVKNIKVVNVTMSQVGTALRVKTTASRGGFVQDIHHELVDLNEISKTVLQIGLDYGDVNWACPTSWNPPPPAVDSIYYIDIKGSSISGMAASFTGLADSLITGVSLENIALDMIASDEGEFLDYNCSYVTGTYKDVSPKPCAELVPV